MPAGRMYRIILFLSIIVFVVYVLTSPGTTAYNHFTLLADAFLRGKFYITADAPWLEKIPIDASRFYIANPPMPAILSIPFVVFFGKNFPQNLIASITGTGIVFFTMLLALRIKKDIKLMIWAGLFSGFGTIIWFLSSVGSTWYFGQITACFFLLGALVEALGKKRVWIVGILVGAAYLARVNTIVGVPIFIYLLREKFRSFKNIFYFCFCLGIFLLTNAFYNFLRFGVFWDKGYLLIPGVSTELWYRHGVENPTYIPDNLRVAFLSLPKFINKFPFFIPSWGGLSIWITTPAFIFALIPNIKERIVQLSWLSLTLVALVVFMHGETGYAQFGYRFAVDFYPFLIFLTLKGIAGGKLKWQHFLLLLISIIVNAWGVILINKFNLVLP